jgi:hypothetical protein
MSLDYSNLTLQLIVGPNPVECALELTHFSHPESMYRLSASLSKLNYDFAVLMITPVNKQYVLLLNKWIITIIITGV